MSDKEEAAEDVSAESPDQGEAPPQAGGPEKKASRSKPRQLTAEEAIAIYRMRPQMKSPGRLRRGAMIHCKVNIRNLSFDCVCLRPPFRGPSPSQ